MWKNILPTTAYDFFAQEPPMAPPFVPGEPVKAGTIRQLMAVKTQTAMDDSGHGVVFMMAVAAKTDIEKDTPNYNSFWKVYRQALPLREPEVGTYIFEGSILGRRRLGNEIFFEAEFGSVLPVDGLPEHVEVPKKSSQIDGVGVPVPQV